MLSPLKKIAKQYKHELLVVLGFLFLALFTPRVTFDWASYVVWAQYIREHGLANIYQLHYVNYMPLNIFALHAWQLVATALGNSLVEAVHWVKIYPMVFDCLTVLLVLQLARQLHISKSLVIIIFMLNPAFHYNSYIWGQFDSVYAFFVVVSLLMILKDRYGLAAVAYLLAMNAKLQAIIFSPLLFVVICLRILSQKKKNTPMTMARTSATVLCLLGIQWVLFMPFTSHSIGEILSMIWQRSSDLSSYVTFNADNFWLLVGAKTMLTQDTASWQLGWSYQAWGYGLFFTSSGVALLPFVWQLCKALYKRSIPDRQLSDDDQIELSVLTGYLISLQFFFFLTQMHERYVHPAVLFATIFVLLQKKWLLLILLSAAYLINMERLLQFWWITDRIQEYVALDMLAAVLFALAWMYGWWLLIAKVRRTQLLRS